MTNEKTKPTFTTEQIKDMRAGLLKLKPDTPTRVSTNRPLVTKEAIMALAPTLIKMRDKGVTTAKLIDFLAAQGLVTQPGTLNRYVNSYQRELKRKESSITAKSNSLGLETSLSKDAPGE